MAITVFYKTVGVAAYGISNPVGARLYYCSNQRVQVTDEKTTNELYGPQDATQVRAISSFMGLLLVITRTPHILCNDVSGKY